jgi:DNA-binding transcriptional ArsR family regulator
VPGEEVPDTLLQALKALADPTRLRIMRYLSAQPMTPADLSRRLRLRAPTVIHHLHALRVAGLLNLTLETSGEKRYAARKEAVGEIFKHISDFLEEDQNNP